MAQRDNNWIIKIGPRFVAHPRGEWTMTKADAYGYHLKKSAMELADQWNAWYQNVVNPTALVPSIPAPGIVCPDIPAKPKVQVIRRKDALDVLPPNAKCSHPDDEYHVGCIGCLAKAPKCDHSMSGRCGPGCPNYQYRVEHGVRNALAKPLPAIDVSKKPAKERRAKWKAPGPNNGNNCLNCGNPYADHGGDNDDECPEPPKGPCVDCGKLFAEHPKVLIDAGDHRWRAPEAPPADIEVPLVNKTGHTITTVSARQYADKGAIVVGSGLARRIFVFNRAVRPADCQFIEVDVAEMVDLAAEAEALALTEERARELDREGAHVITVQLPPNTRVRVALADSDGEFDLEYNDRNVAVYANLPGSHMGDEGLIYLERFGRDGDDDQPISLDDMEAGGAMLSERYARIGQEPPKGEPGVMPRIYSKRKPGVPSPSPSFKPNPFKHEYNPENGQHRIVDPEGTSSGWTSPMNAAYTWYKGAWYVAFADPYGDARIINQVWKMTLEAKTPVKEEVARLVEQARAKQ